MLYVGLQGWNQATLKPSFKQDKNKYLDDINSKTIY